MNAESLLAHYHRIADAPDAVARLRKFILDLAVRGKLVPQDADDEPAVELLKRIAAEKARLVNAGKIKREKVDFSSVGATDKIFVPPTGWSQTRLGTIIHLVSGQHLQPAEYSEDQNAGIPYITGPSDFGETGLNISRYALIRKAVAKQGQLLLTVKGSGVGKNVVCDIDEVAISRQLMALTAIGWDRRYLALVAHALAERLQAAVRSLIPGISREDVENYVFALPPLAEQHRIVAKVDELMALCDQLEASRVEREAKRDRLSAASLARLNTPDPDAAIFADHARFALNALPALTTRPDQIKRLRQTILNLAVRGKLVPQAPKDEHASELLKYIRQTKIELYAERKIPKPKELPALDDMDVPFPLPMGWEWSMLGELCYQVSDGPHFSPNYVPADQGVPFLSTRNVRVDGFDLSSMKHVSHADHEDFCKRIRPEKGDIIYTKGGTTGIAKVNDLEFDFSVWVHLAVLRIEKSRLYPRYIEVALNSPHCYAQSQQFTQGTSNFDLGLTRMIKITLPLPPLPEQYRIVAKVDELMALCDRLEAGLATAADTRRNLLDALLAETLESEAPVPMEEDAA